MTIYLEDDNQFFIQYKEIYSRVEAVIKQTLEMEKVPYAVEVNLTVVDQEEIRQINQEYRQIDKATDVLSFPQIEPIENGKIDWESLNHNLYMNLDTKLLILGDIVLCEEVAKEQAVSYNHSLEREVCFLVAHSMLHLLGYDHMTEEDEQLMIRKQNEVLEALDIRRG